MKHLPFQKTSRQTCCQILNDEKDAHLKGAYEPVCKTGMYINKSTGK